VGLMTHTDWELLRRSPAPVWYVMGTSDKSLIRHVLTALGSSERPETVTDAHDYDVCALSNLIAARCAAENLIVHTYEMPQRPLPLLMPPLATPMVPPPVDRSSKERLAQRHRKAIEAFAQLFQIDPEQVIVEPGRLSDVIGEAVDTTAADLVVMGSRNLSRLQRLLHPVNAESVLARSPCDVLILPRAAVDSESDPVQGESHLDLEAALLDPEAAFGTPLALAEYRGLSSALRLRLLKIWEDDVHAEMQEEEEGGLVRPTRADLLQRIHQAQQRVRDAATGAPQPEFS
jgi:nucleotide-binding universal stress UspA family protein